MAEQRHPVDHNAMLLKSLTNAHSAWQEGATIKKLTHGCPNVYRLKPGSEVSFLRSVAMVPRA